MIKKLLTIFAFFSTLIFSEVFAADPKSVGKYKNWETFVYTDGKGKVCFAQTIPLERAPKNFKREPSRLFVTFRKSEKVKNEISVTSGHEYKPASVTAKTGKNEFSFLSQGNFAWIIDGEEEFNLIKTMKKASKLSISATARNGSQTKDLYSMMGFTKAYNTARKNCA
tara:strand:+ start:11083 stop:11586 length:504 start_codon:yes stop_codon:yes gene_type:complete